MPIVKEERVTKHTVNIYYCDICNENTYPQQCSGCKRFLCSNCQDNWNWYEDAPYCDKCWQIGETYRDQIEDCEQRMYDLKEAWDVECSR